MDFSKITLLPEELKLLKFLKRNGPCALNQELMQYTPGLLTRFHFIESDQSPIFSLTKDGERYLIFLKDSRRLLWLKNAWIPIIVSIVTNLAISGIKWLWPLLQKLLNHIP